MAKLTATQAQSYARTATANKNTVIVMAYIIA